MQAEALAERWGTFEKHSASDVTGVMLGRAILGYVAVITAIITLAPLRFSSTIQHGLTDIWSASDIVLNVVMFVPIGFLFELTRPPRASASPVASSWRALLLGAAISTSIECAQLFEASRFTSLVDVATNALGAMLGCVFYGVATRRVRVTAAVQSLALELPLMGLVYLLVPLMWLVGLGSGGGTHAWLTLPIAAVAGGILGSVHAGYVTPTQERSMLWLAGAAAAWYLVAMLPSGVHDPAIIVCGATLAVGAALLRSIATTRHRIHASVEKTSHARRFELPTLRLVLPLFAAFLALSSLWPLDGAEPSWYGGIALLPPDVEASTVNVLLSLEHIAAFTLVGYVIAEFHGRAALSYRSMIVRVLVWGGGISLLLEITRGWHPSYGASLSMLLFTVSAGAFGGWLYYLQREHVRALARRQGT